MSDRPTNENVEKDEEFMALRRLDSLIPECNLVKSDYETCFENFFPKFLKGYKPLKDPCIDQLLKYQNCLKQGFKTDSRMTDYNYEEWFQMDASKVNKLLDKPVDLS